jgi:teichuronic acid biosynthesis glycosyltransferase TuaC
MYGGIMADQVTQSVGDRPVFVSFCGTDLLGQPLVGCFRKLSAKYNVWASHRAARRATGIVVKSRNLFDALPPDVNRSKVRIIPNGVDLERFKPMEKQEARQILGWPISSKVVLFVTVRGHPRKRLDLAQEAVAKINGCIGDVTLHVMQGVPHDQVPVWMNASDALILTSVHEGSVNTVKEAMACNLPIVSVDVGDVRERLTGVRMCSIADSTPEALAKALGVVLHQGKRSDGRDHLADLTTVAIADRLKNFYGQTLGQAT